MIFLCFEIALWGGLQGGQEIFAFYVILLHSFKKGWDCEFKKPTCQPFGSPRPGNQFGKVQVWIRLESWKILNEKEFFWSWKIQHTFLTGSLPKVMWKKVCCHIVEKYFTEYRRKQMSHRRKANATPVTSSKNIDMRGDTLTSEFCKTTVEI